MKTDSRRLISVVTPCYNEEDNVEECYRAVRAVFEEKLPQYDYEHIFCDNSSSDDTPRILRRLAAADRRLKVIFNSRNFGPFRSLFNGIVSVRGDGVLVFLPADLQDPPDLLPEFVAKWEQGYQVVYGIRKRREEAALMRAVRKVYYRLVSRLANIKIPVDVGEFQFVDKAVIEALRRCDDYYPYVRGMIAHCGFPAAGVEYTWRGRKRGLSKNRLYHLIDQGLNGLISFTNLPMRLCMFAGFTIAAFSLVYAAVAFIINLLYYGQIAPSGIPTLIVAVFFFSGLQLFFFGVLGEYIAAVHFQVRKRPLVVERERLNFGPDPGRPVSAPDGGPGREEAPRMTDDASIGARAAGKVNG
jgi:glycosyltransferase involved in cell wall biosynthesis